ncbi:hypothetical protein ACFQ3Z_00475 [Streptomyces nogalater]
MSSPWRPRWPPITSPKTTSLLPSPRTRPRPPWTPDRNRPASPVRRRPPSALPSHPEPSAPPAATPATPAAPRTLPGIPEGEAGDAWFAHTAGLASTRPNFTQQARSTVFLDATTGILVHRQQTHHLDLGNATAADILTAVFHTVPEGVERIYITAATLAP